jgi:hypothetical protein
MQPRGLQHRLYSRDDGCDIRLRETGYTQLGLSLREDWQVENILQM